MKKLLKAYSLVREIQYFEMIATSFINGQRSQAIEQFRAMPKQSRLEMIRCATIGPWDSGISTVQMETLFQNILN